MYIVCETIPGNDPRFIPELQRMYSHWIYQTYYIAPEFEHLIDLDKYEAINISEDAAKAAKFGNVSGSIRKIGLRAGSTQYDEVFGNSTEKENGTKTYYYIDDIDEHDTVELLKAEMHLYLKKHYEQILNDSERKEFASKRAQIEKEISEASDIINCHRIMHTRFGVECSKDARVNFGLGEPTFDLSTPGRSNW